MKTPANTVMRFLIILGSLGIYAAIFPLLYPYAGPATAALTLIPIATAGWLLGVRGTLIFGILVAPLNSLLFHLIRDPASGSLIRTGLASSVFTLIGIGVAWLRALVEQVNKQADELLAERKLLQEEIVRRTRAEERLVHDALHDPLTNLPNRRLFLDRLEHAVEWSKRNPDNLCAVLYLDLNRFKTINDNLGHDAGDQFLIEVASRLKSSVRAVDTVARMGGDEFAILLEAASTPEDVIAIIQRIQAHLALPYEWIGNPIVSGASIGVVMSLTTYERIDGILRDADIAMYRAKSSGGSEFRVFDVGMREQSDASTKSE